MKELLINGRFLTQPMAGVQRYAQELLRQFDQMLGAGEIDPNRYRLICLAPREANQAPGWQHILFQPTGRFSGNLWEQVDLPHAAGSRLLLNTGNSAPFTLHRQVVCLHDASVFAVPQSYRLAYRLKHRILLPRLAHKVQGIITVSRFSQAELARWLAIQPSRLKVIPLAGEHILRCEPDTATFARRQIQPPYFLCLGGNGLHKNFRVVIEAARLLEPNRSGLVLAGSAPEHIFQRHVQVSSASLILLGRVSDAELHALYHQAAGLILPSFYEGFGLPALEAMNCGCPVIAARCAAIPEVCQQAALYFNHNQPVELANWMERLLADPGLSAKMRRAGQEQALKFSWRKTALETWRYLQEILEGG